MAPFDGVVTARNVDIGSLVTTSASQSEPLFVVADVSKMRVYVRVPEIYAAELQSGMTPTLILPEYPGRKFRARASPRPRTRSTPNRARCWSNSIADNKEGLLKPGAFAQARFQISPPNPDAMSVPASALLFRNEETMLAMVDKANRIQLKKIEIARDYGSGSRSPAASRRATGSSRNPPESIAQGDKVRVAEAAGPEDGPPKGPPKLAESAIK